MNEDFEPKTASSESSSPSYSPKAEPTKKEKKRPSLAAIIALALCFSIIGGLAGSVGAGMISDRLRSGGAITESAQTPETAEEAAAESAIPATPETAATRAPDPTAAATKAPSPVPTEAPTKAVEAMTTDGERKLMSAADVYEATVNSTVGIKTSITTNYWGYQSSGAAAGSGFVYSADGYIITNYHVIEDSSSITVTMYDGTAYNAEVKGYDADNDIAVLKIDAENLTPVTLGSSDQLRVGDEVLAIGNPLGELTFSLTKGCVSALNRDITLSGGITMDLIQTDTAINSGNSGGALFNMYGEVVGITNAKYSGRGYSSASVDNIGFAIPIDNVKRIITDIVEKGHVVKPYIGVTMATLSSDMQSFGYPMGVVIKSVEKDSPAEKAGLKVNDIITAVNGEAVTSSGGLKEYVARCTPGDELVFTVFRQDSEELKLTVTIGERPQQLDTEPTQQPGYYQEWGGSQDDGSGGFPFG